MSSRFIKAVICGLSVVAMFVIAYEEMRHLILICLKENNGPPLVREMGPFFPNNVWLQGVMAPLIWLGITKLAYEANRSLSTVMYRVFIAVMFVATMLVSATLLAAPPHTKISSRALDMPITWKSFVLPALCTIPLLLSVICYRPKKP